MTVGETEKGDPVTARGGRATVATADDSDTSVALHGITVRYGRNTILDSLDLTVSRGEFLALLGPSGSGKTTVIRTIAGFIRPVSGQILLAGENITSLPPNKRGTGVVFQSYALFPHMSVKDNLAYSLKARSERLKRNVIARRVEELLELVRLSGLGNVRPSRLSGGQQQRVALARALAMEPEVLLLDEPLSNLDANLRVDVGAEIRRLQRDTGTTAIMVTHDRREAFSMADRIAVLRDGQIEQLAAPHVLYRQPNSRFIAGFVGDANFVPGVVHDRDGDVAVIDTSVGRISVSADNAIGSEVDLLIRPEDIRLLDADPPSGWFGIEARVQRAAYFGSSLTVDVDAKGTPLSLVTSGSMQEVPADGDMVQVGVRESDCVAVGREVKS